MTKTGPKLSTNCKWCGVHLTPENKKRKRALCRGCWCAWDAQRMREKRAIELKERKDTGLHYKHGPKLKPMCTFCQVPMDAPRLLGGQMLWRCEPCHKKVRKRQFNAYATKIKEETMRQYGGPVCTCCGEEEVKFLSLDHINGGGNRHRKQTGCGSGRVFYRWLKKHGYPPGFQVLCFNCNMSKGFYGECPHVTRRLLTQEQTLVTPVDPAGVLVGMGAPALTITSPK